MLGYLSIYDNKKGKDTAYAQIINSCESGLEKGKISDVDYATLILGISINSKNNADQRYLYEFFYNCYNNYALANGLSPQTIGGGLPVDSGNGHLGAFIARVISKFVEAGYTNSYYTKFQITNPNSNLNLTYS